MIENQLEAIKKTIFLGYSKKYTLYDSGCLVHCVARLIEKPVLEVHDKLKSSGCFFADKTGDVCLLDLTKVPKAYPQLKWISKETQWDQNKALKAIEQAKGLIVEVDSNSIMDGTQQHFVFFRGNGEMEDPLGAKVRKTGYYKVISMRIFELTVDTPKEEKMTEEQQKVFDIICAYQKEAKHGNPEGAANAAVGAARDMVKKEELERNNLKEKCIFLSKLISDPINTEEIILKIGDIKKLGTLWQSLSESAMKFTEKLETEKNQNFNLYRTKNNEFNAMRYIAGSTYHLITLFFKAIKGQSTDEYLKSEIPRIIDLQKNND